MEESNYRKRKEITEVIEVDATVDPHVSTKDSSASMKGGNVGDMAIETSETAPSLAKKSRNNDYDKLNWIVVRNDGKPNSMIKLIGLKALFAKQLPKMPRAYIARLVLDRRHTSLAILQDNKPELVNTDEEIIGAICYRAFPEMRVAEIAFCAVNATHQVKGYGSKLMNLFKNQAVKEGIEYLITYADNYAIGYFKKQGFSKHISMPKGRYYGLIKEYDGGTPMECYVHPSVDYTRIPAMIQAQKNFLLQRVRKTAQSHTTVYDPLPPNFVAQADAAVNQGLASSRINATASRALQIPGIVAAGWTWNDLREANRTESAQQKNLKSELQNMIQRIKDQQFSWPFLEPVDTKEVPDYLDVIKEPMDLSTMEKRIRTDNFYRTRETFFADIQTIVDNCRTYNEDASTYVQCARKLEKFMNDKLK